MKPFRAWINAPSTLQGYAHNYHAMKCIVTSMDNEWCTVYFTDGPIVSTNIQSMFIVKIWG